MRELKFRGKSIASKYVPPQWWYGGIMVYGEDVWMCVKTEEKGVVSVKVDPSTVGQHTGLKDCKNREIYEGDIVEYYDDIEDELLKGFIRYEVDVCSFCIIPINPAEKFGLTAYWSVKVIGNKFENPELMERKEE